MKKNVIKKIVIIGIIVLIIGVVLACILLLGNENTGEVVDKPLEEVTKEDFLDVKVEIEVLGFNYPEFDLDYKNIYKKYVKPNYPNISVIGKETSKDIEIDYTKTGNVISIGKEYIADVMNEREVMDLRPFIENKIFGFTSKKENNLTEFYKHYLYTLSEGDEIYAIPEYINIPTIIYNNSFSEILDVTIPDEWSELAILKGELASFPDYKDHVVAGYDKDSFDIISLFIEQGYDRETALYIIDSWERNNILKGYDKTNMDELMGDLPVIFIMPTPETIKVLGNKVYGYSISGMLLDDDGILRINCNDGQHGKYLSVLKGDNVYEDIASWLYLKESIDSEYYPSVTLKPYLEDNRTVSVEGELNYILLQLVSVYNKMLEEDRIVFYNAKK